MDFTFFDIAIVLLLLFFGIRGLMRGFCKEFFGILGFVVGLWFAYTYYLQLSPYLTFITQDAWRNIIAYVTIFIAINLISAFFAHLLRSILSLALLPWLDSLAGTIFGLIKGFLLASLLTFIAQSFFYEWVQHAKTLPYMTMAIEYIRNILPPDMLNLQL